MLIVTSAPGVTGGVRARYQLRETLVSMLAHIVPGREIVLGDVESRIRERRHIEPDTLRVLTRGIHALYQEIAVRRLFGVSA